MHSAVLILPMALKEAGDQIGAAMGWGPESYTIPLAADGASEATYIGLRADVQPSFIQMIEDAKSGQYPIMVPENILQPVIEALIVDFSQSLWGAEHFDSVCIDHGLMRLT